MNRLSIGKHGEYLVLGELLKQGASIYVPVVDAEGIDAIVRRGDLDFAEIQIKTIGTSKTPRWFQVTNLRPRAGYLIVCVTLAVSPPETWIIPSQVFAEYSTISGPAGKRIFDLDLDSGTRKLGRSKRDSLSEYQDAWNLLIDLDDPSSDELYAASMDSFAEDWDSEEDKAYDRIADA